MKRIFLHPEPTTAELTGPHYWRSLDEKGDSPEFRNWLEREFPSGAAELSSHEGSSSMDRRHFLKIMAASFGLAGLSLSGCREPERAVLSYAKQAEGVVPGVARFFATALPQAQGAIPLIVESHENRPTKIEGNPSYLPYGGATHSFAQASVLDLYDPDRATSALDIQAQRELSLDELKTLLASIKDRYLPSSGRGLAFLVEPSASPTKQRLFEKLKALYPKAIFSSYTPLNFDAAARGYQLAYRKPVRPLYHLDKAYRVLSIDADFLHTEPDHLRHARDFTKLRKLKGAQEAKSLNRLYAVESTFTLSGGMADHRLRLHAQEMEAFAAAVAAEVLRLKKGPRGLMHACLAKAQPLAIDQQWVEACVKDLVAYTGSALVVGGFHLSPEAHALIAVANAYLEAPGHTLSLLEVPEPACSTHITTLAQAIHAGQVQTLFVLGGNPAYNAPASLDWKQVQAKVPQVLRFGTHIDETSTLAHIHIAAHHYLESWLDDRTWDGTYVPVQPLMAPLYATLSELELLAHLAGDSQPDAYAYVRDTFQAFQTVAPAARGTSGVSGVSDTLGVAGTSGVAGASGISDASGMSGTSGSPGMPGVSGVSGTSGLSKVSGKSGPLGTSDSLDISGTSGISSTSGIVGISGISGTSGISGISGISGGANVLGGSFEACLGEGLYPSFFYPRAAGLALSEKAVASCLKPRAGDEGFLGFEGSLENLELRLCPSAQVWDGQYSNNAWLQECPESLNKTTWDNLICISPRLAKELEAKTGKALFPSSVMTKTGQLQSTLNTFEKGKEKAWLAEITVGNKVIRGPLHIQPGLATYTVALSFGYGRKKAGRVGDGVGFDVYPIFETESTYTVGNARLQLLDQSVFVANTQEHWSMEGRAIIREANAEDYRMHPDFVRHMGLESHTPPIYGEDQHLPPHEKAKLIPQGGSLYKTPPFPGAQQWGMTIDLNSCTGCNACVIACQSENNIPVIGKDQVLRGREMHWIRLDRYYSTGSTHRESLPEDPQVAFMGMLCQHCELAPCETVCPVNATVHSEEGLNTMAYNRCVGTRYCANNCPYKVRRFNFFDWNKRHKDHYYEGPFGPSGMAETLKMQKNPDVTVRMRGVMEKCTYCVQRIEQAKITQRNIAKDSGNVKVPDGVIKTACQQVCPTEAIVFGDVADPDTEVSKLKALDRNYDVLGYLNTRPRTSYLARIRNPNPAMPDYYLQPLSTVEYNHKQGHGSHHSHHSPEGHAAVHST